jgi:hypothetical protein
MKQAETHADFTSSNFPNSNPSFPTSISLYTSLNTCWYKSAESGYFRKFLQNEGFTQGCPMSGGFAALVRSILLRKINNELQEQHTPNTTEAPAPHTTSCVDKTNLFLPLEKVEGFTSRFAELGKPLGIKLNLQKTKLLIGSNTYLTPSHQTIINHLSNILQPENILYDGCKLLGQAIGTSNFVNEFMLK